MQIRIPIDGKYNQPNKGEIFGNIHRSTNLDFKTNPGILRLSPRLTLNTKDNDASITGLGTVMSFMVTNIIGATNRFIAACGIGTGSGTAGTGKLLLSASAQPNSAFTVDATSNSPTDLHADYSDAIVWVQGNYAAGDIGKRIITSGYSGSANTIRSFFTSWVANWFSATLSGSFITNGSPKNFCEGFNGNLYITDDYRIIYIPYCPSTSALAAVLTGAGTINFVGKYRPIWMRSSSNRIWVSLMTFDASSGSRGFIGEWDGTGTALNRIYDIDAPCAPSGTIKDDVLHIVDAYGRLKKFNGSGFVEYARLPVANLNIEMPGIYNDLTNSRWIHHRGMEVVDGKININVNNFVSTGVYVKEMPSGIWEYDDNIGLYHKNAPCYSSTDWGQQAVASVGALYGSKKSTGTYLTGISYYTDNATTQRYGIFYDDVSINTNKRGTLEYPFLSSPNLQESWKKIAYRYRPLQSGDHIVVKYRNMKNANLPFIASATWTSTTTFTSTDSNFQYVSVGDEMEIIMGTGSSGISRVTVISLNAGTYTVTIEDAIGGASGSGKVMMTNFKKNMDISTTGLATEHNLIGEFGTKIQIKTHFIGTGDFEVDDLTLDSTKQQ